MEKVIAYKANNGRLFETEEKCVAYEKKMAQYPKVTDSVTQAEGKADIFKHVIMWREKPYSKKNFETYYIVGGKYKFIDCSRWHDKELMVRIAIDDKPSMRYDLAAGYFAYQILQDHELTDEYLSSEIDKINSKNTRPHLVLHVIESGRKWEIYYREFSRVGYTNYTFIIEKLA